MAIKDPHPTLVKFGYPDNLLHEGDHWAVLVRPEQPTLGSLVLCATGAAAAYGDLPAEAFAEQGRLIKRIETFLREFSKAEKINYLMLMMVDPQVHFHVLPRYSGERRFEGTAFIDSGWPALPDLGRTVPASGRLIETMAACWASSR
ncbi:HIT family protein [Sphingomonas swuensis]|uniref:HIT family protein n=1 Tax=Sphingomonas swuensis TaxID=977800 RepID=A0ABP7SVI7_9SPHN